jgi:hypothetical protein
MVDRESGAYVRPEFCGRCPHPISDHVLWEPDAQCGGWMHCTADGCMNCWHEWSRLSEALVGLAPYVDPTVLPA